MRITTAPTLALSAVIALALVGCSGGNVTSSDSPTFDPRQLVSSTPPGTKQVDHVTWGMHTGEPETIDPVRVGNDSGFYAIANLCDTLLRTTPEFGVESNVAETVEWANDTTLVIDLRDDVVFWDGTPLTSDDVAYSLSRMMDPASQSVNTSAFGSVASVDVTGPTQVTLTLSQPDSQLRNALAGPAGYVFQKAFTEATGEEEIGTPSGGIMCTGPFELDKWNPGDSIVMTANEQYWQKKPLVKELEITFVESDATLTSALLSGQIDGAFSVPAASLDQFRDSDTGRFYAGPSSAFSAFAGASADGPGADPQVRTALDLAIDKQAVVDTVLHGLGEPIKTFVPPFLWEDAEAADIYREGYDALPDNSGGDVEAAKKLIDEAGYAGAKLVLAITAGDQAQLQLGTIVQAAGKDIGLDIQIEQLQAAEFSKIFYDPTAREGLDLVATVAYSDTPVVLQYPSFFVLPDGLFNWTEYEDADVTKYMADARAATDPAASAEAFVKAQAIYGPERIMIPIANEYSRSFLNNRLTGLVTSFSAITSPWALDLGGK